MLVLFPSSATHYIFSGLLCLALMQHACAHAKLIDVDIPAQDLSTALKHYASLSQQPILIRSALSAGVQSSAVKGRYTSLDALRALLRNTGLQVSVIEQTPHAIYVIQAQPKTPETISLQGYPGLIQQQIMRQLCLLPPAQRLHRSLIQIRLSPQGRIIGVHVLHPSTQPSYQQTLQQQLQHLNLGAPPPARLPQPITLLLEPSLLTQHKHCTRHE